MVATAAWCSRALAECRYDLAVNVGLCGSFDASLVPGTVVHVVSDRLAELGAEDGERFLPLDALGLEDALDPALGTELRNTDPPAIEAARPPAEGARHHRQHGSRPRAIHCGRPAEIESTG